MPMHRHLLLSCAVLLTLPGGRAEEAPKPPPTKEAPTSPPYDAARTRRELEQLSQEYGWYMTYREDDDLVVAGTCDTKIVEDGSKISRQAVDKVAALLKTDARDLQGNSKLYIVYLSKKQQYMEYAKDEATAQKDEGLLKLLGTAPGYAGFLCLDPAYGVSNEHRRHLTLHGLGHLTLNNYASHHGGAPIPGWISEGFAAWLDASILASPGACCTTKVGYLENQYQKHGSDVNWDRVAFQVVKDYQAGKADPKTGKPAYTRLGNLMGKKLSNLTGPDVAVSWSLIKDLARKPEEFKAFLDAIFTGTKQADAFQTAFKQSVDEYEKDWIKAILKKTPAEAK